MVDFIQLELFDSTLYYDNNVYYYPLALIDTLKYLTKDFCFESEASEPYQVFEWLAKEKSDFSVEKLLLSIGYLKIIEPQHIFDDIRSRTTAIEQLRLEMGCQQTYLGFQSREAFVNALTERLRNIRNQYLEIYEQLHFHLENIQIYRLNTNDLDFQRIYDIYIIVGQAKNGSWVGFSTKLHEIGYGKGSNLPLLPGRESIDVDNNLNFLITVFEKISRNFSYLPEIPYYFDWEFKTVFPYFKPNSNYSFDRFIYEIANNSELLVKQLLESIGFLKIESFSEYIDSEGSIGSEQYRQRSYELFTVMDCCLKDMKVYWFGLVEKDVYFIGKILDSDRFGVCSVAVNT